MKRAFFILIQIVFAGLYLSGQSFISEDKQWNVRLNYFMNHSMEITKISGDTLIDSLTYRCVWSSYDSLASWAYMGALREEGPRVYYIPPGSMTNKPGLLYDFSLNVGDTALITNYFCEQNNVPVVVANIDTLVFNGFSHKRWHLEVPGQWLEAVWLEGIGSLNGPVYGLFEYCIVCPHWDLLCYFNNDTLQYRMPLSIKCWDQHIGIEEPVMETRLTISPNPVNRGDVVTITTSLSPKTVTIFNPAGMAVRSFNTEPSETVMISTDMLAPGLYFISLNSLDSRVMTARLIVR